MGRVETFAVYLDGIRRRAGLSPADLARAAHVSDSLVSRWLDGKSTPGLANLRKVAPSLGVPLAELLVAAGHMTAEEIASMTEAPVSEPESSEQLVRRAAYAEGLRGEQIEEAVRIFKIDVDHVRRHVPHPGQSRTPRQKVAARLQRIADEAEGEQVDEDHRRAQ